jgi:hypothetical protein
VCAEGGTDLLLDDVSDGLARVITDLLFDLHTSVVSVLLFFLLVVCALDVSEDDVVVRGAEGGGERIDEGRVKADGGGEERVTAEC